MHLSGRVHDVRAGQTVERSRPYRLTTVTHFILTHALDRLRWRADPRNNSRGSTAENSYVNCRSRPKGAPIDPPALSRMLK
jgi:hypothetical protein